MWPPWRGGKAPADSNQSEHARQPIKSADRTWGGVRKKAYREQNTSDPNAPCYQLLQDMRNEVYFSQLSSLATSR